MLKGKKFVVFLQRQKRGALAQLARALAWHARGHRFDSVMLHMTKENPLKHSGFSCLYSPLNSFNACCKISSIWA